MISLTGRNYKKRSGFTLIEILLVVLILTVIMGVAIPNLSQTYKKVHMQKVVQDIRYIMEYGQSRAITHNQPVRLEFNEDFSQYWLTQKDPQTEQFQRIPGRLGKRFGLSPKVDIDTDQRSIHFFPDGSIEKQEIIVSDNHDREMILSTKLQRGRIEILSRE
jgi:prepilin-type N-terminal cleavage/methylation domain-containing protein